MSKELTSENGHAVVTGTGTSDRFHNAKRAHLTLQKRPDTITAAACYTAALLALGSLLFGFWTTVICFRIPRWIDSVACCANGASVESVKPA